MNAPVKIDEWISENSESFKPPICNKLMYKKDLSVMFVGGPNRRTDFHVDESSEFFFQLRGSMELPIVEKGIRRVVKIQQGEVFLLPSRIPHSPQRPETDSIGLVVERSRNTEIEFDCMRWYEDFLECDAVQFEKFFQCNDLGKDLVPVASEYRLFMEEGSQGFERSKTPLIVDDVDSVVPAPFNLKQWCRLREAAFQQGVTLSLFGDTHPDQEFSIQVSSEEGLVVVSDKCEVFLHQLAGQVDLSCQTGGVMNLPESSCFVVPRSTEVTLTNRTSDSLTLILYCDPLGNKAIT